MKARCVEFDGERATVVLTPSWIQRLFGAEELRVELYRTVYESSKEHCAWRTAGTHVRAEYVRHGDLILRALDFRPMPELPPAKATLRLVEARVVGAGKVGGAR